MESGGADAQGLIRHWLSAAGSRFTANDVEKLIEATIPDLTFGEAYAKTGRQVSITVAPAEPHQRSRLLNAVSSPNVFLRSAAIASCAIPGVFPAVMLKAKNEVERRNPICRQGGGWMARLPMTCPLSDCRDYFPRTTTSSAWLTRLRERFYREMTKHVRFGRPRRLWGWGSVGRC